MPDSTTDITDNPAPRLRIIGGGASPEWGLDAARINLAQAAAQMAFATWQAETGSREDFVERRNRYRVQYAAYVKKWGHVPEATKHFEDRFGPAPAGWNDELPPKPTEPVTVNLNWVAEVTLSREGVAALRRHEERVSKLIGRPAQVKAPELNGKYRFQLSDLFHIFGESMPGIATMSGVPFETNFVIEPT